MYHVVLDLYSLAVYIQSEISLPTHNYYYSYANVYCDYMHNIYTNRFCTHLVPCL